MPCGSVVLDSLTSSSKSTSGIHPASDAPVVATHWTLEKLDLSVRSWECLGCSSVHDRDNPAIFAFSQDMPDHERVIRAVDQQLPVKTNADADLMPNQCGGNTVAIAFNVNVGINRHSSCFSVAGVVTDVRQLLEMRLFFLKAVCDFFFQRVMMAFIRYLCQPATQLLVQVLKAFEASITLEKVFLYIAHHTLGFTLGSRPVWFAGFRLKLIVSGQQ